MRIAVNKGAAYDLFLTRSLKQATLVRAEESFDLFLREGLEAVAGVKQGVVRFVEAQPGGAHAARPLHGDPAGDVPAQGPRRRRAPICAPSSRR